MGQYFEVSSHGTIVSRRFCMLSYYSRYLGRKTTAKAANGINNTAEKVGLKSNSNDDRGNEDKRNPSREPTDDTL